MLFSSRHVEGVYWVRWVMGGCLYLCCDLGVLHEQQMTCRNAPVGSRVGKGLKGLVGSMSDLQAACHYSC